MTAKSKSPSLIACCALLALAAAPALAQTHWFAASLDGGAVVGDSGDADGRGVAAIGLDQGSVWYYVWVTDVAQPTAAHIHTGAAGSSGGVAVGFDAPFTEVGDRAWVAVGDAAADAGLIDSLGQMPAAYYVNVHNADHPAGAVRGQLLGQGPSPAALAASLRGARVTGGGGDPDGAGFGIVVFDDRDAYYYLKLEGVATPTAAHIHQGEAGKDGGVFVDLAPAFVGGVATGVVSLADDDRAARILAMPDAYYLNVHSSDYPSGAARGQLKATETVVHFPVVSRAAGQAGSNWRTDVRILNLDDEDATLYAEWFPSSAAAADGPASTVQLVIGAGSQAVVNDAVATLFAADGNGAMRLLSPTPFCAGGRVFNDQRDNPAVGGTYGQFSTALTVDQALASGALLLSSNRPASDAEDFRSNLGYFNPNPHQVQLTLNARTTSGELLGFETLTLAAFSNQVRGVFQLIPSVPAADQTQQDFYLSFSASDPVFLYLSVVDNVTGDAILVLPQPIPAALTVATVEPENSPPNGTIVEPAGDVTVTAGESVSFAGSADDPDGDPLSYLWDFGDGISSTLLSPGAHTYSEAGTYTITFTVTDSRGAADPTPDSRTVTAQEASQAGPTFTEVQSQIFTPSCAFSGCHGGSSPAQGMSLVAGQAWGAIVDVPSAQQPSRDRIEPFDPEASYLYLKVTGDSSISGSQMPRGGSRLSTELLALLREWIERGAPND